jgi:hypothetical protein
MKFNDNIASATTPSFRLNIDTETTSNEVMTET